MKPKITKIKLSDSEKEKVRELVLLVDREITAMNFNEDVRRGVGVTISTFLKKLL